MNNIEPINAWTEEIAYQGKHRSFRILRNPSLGIEYDFIQTRTGQGVSLMVVRKDKVLLVSQYRPPAGVYTLEFPGGAVDAGEETLNAAVRELHEETGVLAKDEELVFLSHVYDSPAIVRSRATAYFFRLPDDYLVPAETSNLNEGEIDNVIWMPIEEYENRYLTGEDYYMSQQFALIQVARHKGLI